MAFSCFFFCSCSSAFISDDDINNEVEYLDLEQIKIKDEIYTHDNGEF